MTSTRVTRCGVPPRVIPVQSSIAVPALQSSAAVPRSVSLASSSSAQSATRSELLAGFVTTAPFSHAEATVTTTSALTSCVPSEIMYVKESTPT